jgi:hypothetical protein
MPVPKELLAQVKHLIPPMNGSLHKGQSGRVGVLGGAMECVHPTFVSISYAECILAIPERRSSRPCRRCAW